MHAGNVHHAQICHEISRRNEDTVAERKSDFRGTIGNLESNPRVVCQHSAVTGFDTGRNLSSVTLHTFKGAFEQKPPVIWLLESHSYTFDFGLDADFRNRLPRVQIAGKPQCDADRR